MVILTDESLLILLLPFWGFLYWRRIAAFPLRRYLRIRKLSLFQGFCKWLAGITKRVTSHTFRHTFASHLLRANYDLRTIQQLLGHADIRTTMIYTHTVRSRTLKEAESPLDFPEALLDTLEGFEGGYVEGK